MEKGRHLFATKGCVACHKHDGIETAGPNAADGKPQNLTVLDSTDAKWAQAALHKLNSWRFYPSMLQGSAVEAEGVFELTHGRERPPAKK